MNRQVIFKAKALVEFTEAAAWYEKQRPGLGGEFIAEVGEAIQRAQADPERFQKIRHDARKIHLRRFASYNIFFAVKPNVFSVLAVFHGSRNPKELSARLK